MGELILVRHGETEWSRSGQYAGRTNLHHPHTGTLSTLGYEHEQTVISAWNVVL